MGSHGHRPGRWPANATVRPAGETGPTPRPCSPTRAAAKPSRRARVIVSSTSARSRPVSARRRALATRSTGAGGDSALREPVFEHVRHPAGHGQGIDRGTRAARPGDRYRLGHRMAVPVGGKSPDGGIRVAETSVRGTPERPNLDRRLVGRSVGGGPLGGSAGVLGYHRAMATDPRRRRARRSSRAARPHRGRARPARGPAQPHPRPVHEARRARHRRHPADRPDDRAREHPPRGRRPPVVQPGRGLANAPAREATSSSCRRSSASSGPTR